VSEKMKTRPSIIQRMPLPLALLFGFLLLPLGGILLPITPEIGVPLLLVATRLLGRRFQWARRFNAWIDGKWQGVRARLKGDSSSGRPALWRWIVGYAAGAVSWMVSGHATWKTGPLLHVAKAIPEAETINNVDQQVLAMAFAIIRYFGDKSAGSKRQRFAR
jgi:hypothetical protein